MSRRSCGFARIAHERSNGVATTRAIFARGSSLADALAASVQSFPIYLFIFIVFLNRYVFGWYLTILKGKRLDPKISGTTIVIVGS